MFLQAARHTGDARSVQRRVDDRHIAGNIFWQHRRSGYRRLIPIYGVFADIGDPFLAECCFEIHRVHIGKRIDLVDLRLNGLRRLCGDLAAIRAIDLVPVILCRIVTCRDDDASITMQIADGEGQRGRWHQMVIQMHHNTICGKHTRRRFRKGLRVNTTVISNSNSWLYCHLFQVVAIPLCGLSHRVYIHAVRAGPQHAAQTTCTKLQFAIKTILNGVRIAADVQQFFLHRHIVGCFFQPQLVKPHHVHQRNSSSMILFSFSAAFSHENLSALRYPLSTILAAKAVSSNMRWIP